MSEKQVVDIKVFARNSIILTLVLGVVTLLLSPFAGCYRGEYLLLTLGGIVTVTSAIYLPVIHLKRTTLRDIAVPAIQCLWITTSMGLGYLVTAPAPYFRLAKAVEAVMLVIGALLLVYGVFALLRISRETGVPLAV